MKSIAKLKDRARKFEQKEDWQAAIQAYQQVLDQEKEQDQFDLELGLFNRIGDLYLRLGQTDEAVSYYETAADHYTEAGFLNNAIALCNKALRHRPDRPAIYLKLSGLCAEQGFQTDARRWILEYADRQIGHGRVEAALTGLEEFAESSGDPEVRERLAEHLAEHGQADEAIQQLRVAYDTRLANGQDEKAAATVELARSIDPDADLGTVPPLEYDLPVRQWGDEPGSAAPEPEAAEPEPAEPESEPDTGVAGLETHRETIMDAGEPPVADALEGFETTTAAEEPEPEPEAEPADLEVSDEATAPTASGVGGSLGGIETFDDVDDTDEMEDRVEGPEPDEEPDEEPEPLPLLDTGYEEEPAEEPEPLPPLEEPDEAGAGQPAGVAPEAEPGAETDTDLEAGRTGDAGEAMEAMDLESFDLDVPSSSGEDEPVEETQESAIAEHLADAMDLDLGSFDLGMGSVEPHTAEGEGAARVDVDAILQLGRELVSRGLKGEALRELRLLSSADAGPAVYEQALMIVNEILRHDPNNAEAHRRKVDYLGRLDDPDRLAEAYTALGDALTHQGLEDEAKTAYDRAAGTSQEEIAADVDQEPETPPADREPDTPPADREQDTAPADREQGEADATAGPEEEAAAIDLEGILRDMDSAALESAVEAAETSDPAFAVLLRQLREKIDQEVGADEAAEHYDLGLAFKEMGLLDEAISEFQTALTGGADRLKVYEELGHCYFEAGQYAVAIQILAQAPRIPGVDEADLVGVHYHLGKSHEELGQRDEALAAYRKVLSVDDSFADVPERIARL